MKMPLILAALAALLPAPLLAGFIEEAEQHRLENGLNVVLIHQPGSPMISVSTLVLAGVRDETAETNGASHFLEHLLFNGTTSRTQKELYDEADYYGIYNNASTRPDYTVFIMLVATEYLEKGLNIQADMLFNSTVPPENFEKERNIVLEEIARDGHRANYLAEQFYRSFAYAGSAYTRPVLGSPKSLKSITRETVWNYYRRSYRPENMTLLIMGDYNPETILDSIRKEYGAKRPAASVTAAGQIRFDWSKSRLQLKHDSTFDRHYVDLALPAPLPLEDDYVAMEALTRILDQRLTDTFTRKQHLADRIDFYVKSNRDFSTARLSFQVASKAEPLSIARKMLAALRCPDSYQVSRAELQGLVRELVSRDIYLSEKVHYFIFQKAGDLVAGGVEFLKRYVVQLRSLRPSQLAAAGMKYLAGARVVGTIRGPLVKDRILADWVGGGAGTPLKGKAIGVAEKVRREVFSNGLTVIVAQDKNSSIAAIHLLVKDRCLAEPRGKEGIADFLHQALTRGTSLQTAEEIRAELSSISAVIKVTDNRMIPFDDYYFSPEYSFVRLETLEPYLERGLLLLADLVRRPSFPADAVENLRRNILERVTSDRLDLIDRVHTRLYQELFQHHPFARPITGTKKSISSISAKDLKRFRKSFFSPENLVISIVSGRSPREVLTLCQRFLGDMKKTRSRRKVKPFPHKLGRPETVTLPAANAPQAKILFGKLVHPEEEEQPALTLAAALLSERVAFQLREREGLAYSVGCRVQETRYGHYFVGGVGTRPKNIERVRAGFLREVADFLNLAVDEQDLNRTRNRILGRQKMRRLTSMGRAFYAGLNEARGHPVDFDTIRFRAMEAVTPEEVVHVARKHLNPRQMTVVIGQ